MTVVHPHVCVGPCVTRRVTEHLPDRTEVRRRVPGYSDSRRGSSGVLSVHTDPGVSGTGVGERQSDKGWSGPDSSVVGDGGWDCESRIFEKVRRVTGTLFQV